MINNDKPSQDSASELRTDPAEVQLRSDPNPCPGPCTAQAARGLEA